MQERCDNLLSENKIELRCKNRILQVDKILINKPGTDAIEQTFKNYDITLIRGDA